MRLEFVYLGMAYQLDESVECEFNFCVQIFNILINEYTNMRSRTND